MLLFKMAKVVTIRLPVLFARQPAVDNVLAVATCVILERLSFYKIPNEKSSLILQFEPYGSVLVHLLVLYRKLIFCIIYN